MPWLKQKHANIEDGRITRRFRNINIAFLLAAFVLVAAVVAVQISGITGSTSEDYARFYAAHTVERFSLYVIRDLTLVQNVSRSQAVTNWFADEQNEEKKQAAYVEMMDHADMLQSASLYFGIQGSLNEYSVVSQAAYADFEPFDVLDPTVEYNQWYYECIAADTEYTLNIDVDKVTQTRRLWINYKVEKDGIILGVFCSGLPFDAVVGNLFDQYDAGEVRGFIIDRGGFIQMDSSHYGQRRIVQEEEGRHILSVDTRPAFAAALDTYLAGVDGIFDMHMEPQVIYLGRGQYSYMSIAPISGTDWAVVTLFDASSLFSPRQLLPLIIVMLSAFVLYALAGNALMSRIVLLPLKRLMDSVSAAGESDVPIFGSERRDEFGELAQTIVNMRDRLRHSNAELLQAAGERDRQSSLLQAVNSAAAVLLTADEGSFEDSLKEGIALMADCLDVDRIYIWQNEVKDARLCYTQKFEWVSDIGGYGDTVPPSTSFAYAESLYEWEKKFMAGQCVNGSVLSLSPHEQEMLAPYGIKSILVIPVFLQDTFWGFVSFDDCHSERTFADDEISILRSCSLLFANALIRNEMTQDIRTALLQLEVTAHEAQAASRAKSNFLSNMSHEMRTPMNAIIGMTMIGKSAAEVERKDYAFGKIEDASNHLLGVINDVLDMSKIEANKFELSVEEFDFEKMLQKVVNVVNFRVDEKQQNFTVYLAKNIPQTMVGDDIRLAQVITNLLSNAIKFTPEQGSIRLSVHFVKEEQGIISLQISVADTGIGISEEQQARLFSSFEQAESSTSRKFGGTGLGLSISKHIVELMGGSIWIESELGKGSTFFFTVQLKRGTAASRNLLNPGVNWSNVRMLIVDDDAETREYFAIIAEQLALSCDEAADAGEAMRMIDEHGPYDLYFVDWNMPLMNGIELTAKIKERVENKGLVVMISAAEWSSIEEKAREAGVDIFLPKPLFTSSVAECVNKCLCGQSAPAEQHTQPEQTDNFSGYYVLLAEDVEVNREIVLAMLEPLRVKVDCASNGIEAVRMFSQAPQRYDIIFMDVQMPEMDGLEATRRIRALDLPQAAEVPVVAMTANVFKEDVEVCLAAGMNDHVGKPLDIENLLAKMRAYLPRK